jgi:hypothetical protein
VDELKGSDMSVGDQRFETRMPSFKAASAADDRCGRNKRPYQIGTLYEHGGLMTANCLWRTGESSMSCAPLPHRARQTATATADARLDGQG